LAKALDAPARTRAVAATVERKPDMGDLRAGKLINIDHDYFGHELYS
jgi:hypothetical protein